MPPTRYLNFDLLIDRAVTGYQARVIESPAGQAACPFQLPAGLDAQPGALALVGGAIRAYQWAGGAGQEAPTPRNPKVFGEDLFQAVFAGDVGDALRRSLDLAAQQEVGLRIRLRLTYAPELAALPWEYLYVTPWRRFAVLSDQTPLVRYLEIGQGAAPLTTQLPLRVLVMLSDPVDVTPRLNVEAEWVRLEQALAELQRQNAILLTRIPATLTALQRTLRRDAYHLFHFIGHGWYDEATGDAGLLLEDEQRNGERVDATRLGILLHDHRALRLAFLNACEGARVDRGEPFTGVAQHLVQQGLPAVIAMQFPITDRAAITLAQEFYQALADGYPVDAALTEARKAIFAGGSLMEWGTPAIFTRADDNQLFALPGAPGAADEAPARASTVVNTGGGAYVGGNVNTGGGDFVGRDKRVRG